MTFCSIFFKGVNDMLKKEKNGQACESGLVGSGASCLLCYGPTMFAPGVGT